MKRRSPPVFARRDFLTQSAALALIASLPTWPFVVVPRAQGQSQGNPKFLHIFLRGGWDSHLATDPVIGTKASSNVFASAYQNYSVTTINGKSNLKVGWGLEPAKQAMAAVPTCFINGLFTEVTAHELAQGYMYSGVLSLSRTREFPTIAALMGAASQHFPAHVVLGAPVPLGSTRSVAPPLQAASGANLADMLRGPYMDWTKDSMIEEAHRLLGELDGLHRQRLGPTAQKSLEAWNIASERITQLYAAKLGSKLELTAAIKARYGFTEPWSMKSLLPSAYLGLATGLAAYATVSWDGFDTHSNHLSQHVPLMRDFATQLQTFIDDLRTTPDPHQPNLNLIDTTTVLITSEFVRTPNFNAGAGTDHHPVAAAILMGRGVRDNTVVGSTDDQARALGWSQGQAVPRNDATAITPSFLAATLLAFLGFTKEADTIDKGRLDDVLA